MKTKEAEREREHDNGVCVWVTVGACLLLRALCDDCPANRTCTLVGIHRAALAGLGLPNRYWPVGLMDKASASGAGDSRFESWAGQDLQHYFKVLVALER